MFYSDRTDAAQTALDERSIAHSAYLTSAHLMIDGADAAHTQTKPLDDVLLSKAITDGASSMEIIADGTHSVLDATDGVQ